MVVYFECLKGEIASVKLEELIILEEEVYTKNGLSKLYIAYDIGEHYEYYIDKIIYEDVGEKYPNTKKDKEYRNCLCRKILGIDLKSAD